MSEAIPIFIIIVSVIGALFYFLSKERSKQKTILRNALLLAGNPVDRFIAFKKENPPILIAINPDERSIVLLFTSEHGPKKYSLSDIRSWGRDSRDQVFIEVRDIDKPRWGFPMNDNEKDRCIEVLRQAINE